MTYVLFDPKILNERWGAFGSEHELHALKGKKLAESYDANFPQHAFFANGAKAYWDCGHYEVASQEAPNPLALVCFNRAALENARALNSDLTFIKNSADHSGHTSGAHENYFTSLDIEKRLALIPLLISLQPLIGAGCIDSKTGEYHIHQRAKHIVEIEGKETLWSRSILNTREEPLSSVEGFYRMHHILNDANMCVAAELIKYGVTALAIQCIEEGTFKPLDYNLDKAVEDLHSVSLRQDNWELFGAKPNTMTAVAIQDYYYTMISENLKVRSPLRDIVLNAWAHGINLMAEDPVNSLVGFADWATKKHLIDIIKSERKCMLKDDPCIVADTAYHILDPEQGAYYYAEEVGLTALNIPLGLINHYRRNPPTETRAFARGKAIQLLTLNDNKSPRAITGSVSWEQCTIGLNGARESKIIMKDPRNSYREEIRAIYKGLGIEFYNS